MLLCGILVLVFIAASLLLPLTAALCLLGVLCLLLTLLLLVRRWRYAVVVFSVAVALLSVLRGVVYQALQVPDVSSVVGSTELVTARVLECPTSGNMYTVEILGSVYLPKDTRLLLYCNDRTAPRLNEIVSTGVEYQSLHSTHRYHRADGVYLQAFPVSDEEEDFIIFPPDSALPPSLWLLPLREHFSAQIATVLNGDEGELLTAMCLGDRSGISGEVYDDFRVCGLPHLIAVSGLHMAVIADSLRGGLRTLRVRRRVIGIVTLLAIAFYMWLVGLTPSVLRSGIMYGIVLAGMLFRHQSDSLNSLGLAMTLILLFSPNALYDMGFWLSFGSTAGIVCLLPRLRSVSRRAVEHLPHSLHRPVGWFAENLSITVAATLPLLPLMAVHFRQLSLVSPLANLLTVTPSAWMLVLGFLGILLRCTGVLYWIGDLLLLLAGLIAKYMIAVAEWIGSFSGAVLLLQQWWQIVWIVGAVALLFVLLYRFRVRTLCGIWCVLLVVLLSAHGISAQLHRDTTTVRIVNDGGRAVIILEHRGQAAVLAHNLSSVYAARSALEQDGYLYPQVLLFGGGKTMHTAYLTDWLADHPDIKAFSTGSATLSAPQATVLSTSNVVEFWEDHSLQILSGGWWRLTMGETVMLIASPSGRPFPAGATADVYLLRAGSLSDVLTLEGKAIFWIDSSYASVHGTDGVEIIPRGEDARLITTGNGDVVRPVS